MSTLELLYWFLKFLVIAVGLFAALFGLAASVARFIKAVSDLFSDK